MATNYTYKVELEGTTGFILDTDLLDTGLLGYLTIDVTSYVRSVSIKRGKSTSLDEFTAGQMTVVFDNRSRAFDPNYSSSPYYGAIVPRRKLIFSIFITDDAYYTQFTGFVDSWSFAYDVSTESTSTASCSDGFTILANQDVTLSSPSAELSSDRIQRVLLSSGVNWDYGYSLVGGAFTMGSASYSGNALQYIQQIALSESAYFFVSQSGVATYKGWNGFNTSWPLLFKGKIFGGTASTVAQITNIEMEYASEQLYNYVTVQGAAGTVTAQDVTSQVNYGISAQTFDVLTSGTAQMQTLANYLITNYDNPRLRISQVSISLDNPNFTQANGAGGYLSTDIGDQARVIFTPNSIGTATDVYAWIIGKSINATPESCEISFSLASDEARSAV